MEWARPVGTPGPLDPGELPIACSLSRNDGAQRGSRWSALMERANPIAAATGELLRSASSPVPGYSKSCCSFVTWIVTEDNGTPVLRIFAKLDSPDDIASIAALFRAS